MTSGQININNNEFDINDSRLNFTGFYHSDPFWLEQPSILYQKNNYYRFFPSDEMTRIEKLNALSRFFIYLLIIFILLGKNNEYIYFPIIGLILVFIIYLLQKRDSFDQKKEKFCQNKKCKNIEVCIKPTIDNPFMNVTLADWREFPNRPPTCDPLTKDTQREMSNNFYHNMFLDADDVYRRGHSQRQFYSMPNTTIPNRQTDLAKWLYRLPTTCKEDTHFCMRYNYEDPRYKRYAPNIDRLKKVIDEKI
jgi:hypothetical protein